MAERDAEPMTAAAAPHPAVGDLPALLEALRAQDRLTIGVERAQHAAALLQRLQGAGITLDDPRLAATWLAPVLCVSQRDRAALADRLLRRFARAEAGIPAVAPPRDIAALHGELAEAEARRARRRPWLIVLAGLAVLAGAGLAVWQVGGDVPGTAPAPSDGGSLDPTDLGTLALIGGALALGAVVWALARRLLRRAPRLVMPVRRAIATGHGLAWFDEAMLEAPLRMLGRQRRAVGRQLDLVETVARTVRRAGWPELVRGGRLRTPRHLVLVQLDSADDPTALAAASLLDRLRRADLQVVAYAVDGEFRAGRPWGGGPAEPLASVAARHQGARLLLVGDGDALYDPFTDRLQTPRALDAFPMHALATPLPRARWGWRERRLDSAGWRLAELSTEGIADLARWLSGPREALPPLVPAPPTAASLPELLARDDRLFSDSAVVPAELRARLLERLRGYLDPDPRQPPDGFALLQALAVGATIAPTTVEHVAGHLASLDGPRPEEGALRRLLALPWLERGRLPAWLRQDLVAQMPGPLAEAARRAWLLHLANERLGRGDLGTEAEERLSAEARRVLRAGVVLADPLMLTALRLSLQAEPTRLTWRDTLLATGVAALAAGLVWLLGQVGPLLLALVEVLYRPLAPLIAAQSPWPPVLAVLAASAMFLRPRGVRATLWVGGLAALAAYLAGAPFLSGAWVVPGPVPAVTPAYTGAPMAVLGLVARRLAWPPTPPILVPRAAFMPGHAVLNLVAVLALALFVWTASFTVFESTDSAVDLLTLECILLVIALGLSSAVAWRLARAGFCDRATAIRLAIIVAFSQAAIVGAWDVLVGTAAAAADLQLGPPWVMAIARFDLRLIAGVAMGLMALGLIAADRPRWFVLVTGTSLALTLCAAVLTEQQGIRVALLIAGQVILAATGPALAGRGKQAPEWRMIGLLVVPIAAMASLLAWRLTRETPDISGSLSVLNLLDVESLEITFVYLKFLILATTWPLVRALRPDMATSGQGLWWRCLLFVPCWISVSVGGMTLGGAPILAVPIAAWLAQRFGTRALPAITVALLPMFLGFIEINGPVRIAPFGAGWALAALLVAKVVADASFRAACLARERLGPGGIAVLVLLGFAYAPMSEGSPLSVHALAWPLLLLLGLSRVPAGPVLSSVAVASLVGTLATAMGLLPFGRPTTVEITFSWNNLPNLIAALAAFMLPRLLMAGGLKPRPEAATNAFAADIVAALLLALEQGRLVRRMAAAAVASARPVLIGLLGTPPLWLILAAGAEASLLSFSLFGVRLDPLNAVAWYLLCVFWRACDQDPEHYWAMKFVPLPKGQEFAAMLVALAMLLPALTLAVGPVSLSLFGGGVWGAARFLLASLCALHMGASLRPLLEASPPGAAGRAPFGSLPVRAGAVAASAGLVAAVAVLGFLLLGWMERSTAAAA